MHLKNLQPFYPSIGVHIIDKDVHAPHFSTDGSAGLDLYARETVVVPSLFKKYEEYNYTINKPDRKEMMEGIIKLVPLNICLNQPISMYSLLLSRSSLSVKHGIIQANSVGLIDSDYYNEVLLAVYNIGFEDYTIERGDKIAQLILYKNTLYNVYLMDNKMESKHTGFGSTGKK